MKLIENFDDYRTMVDEVKVLDFRYFSLNLPIISDEEYDTMYFALQEYEDAHPDEVLKDSPTQQCYSENGNGKRTVARRSACLSMKKVHDANAVMKYLRAQQRAANISSKGAKVAVEWKFDGETVSLVYRQGMLSEATYGHGKELFGNDCLEHIKHVQGVPHQVAAWSQFDRVEVRGEVIISLSEFTRYGKAGKSPRSTSNGIMAKKVAVASECSRLDFHPFRLIMDGVVRHMAAMQALERNGFTTSGFLTALDLEKTDAELAHDIESVVCAAEIDREKLPFPTDGLVFKFDNYDCYDRIGYTDHDAKYNCAFKFRPVFKAVTTFRGHHTTTGEKTGKVTYVADFDEVEMNGHRFAHANCGSARTFLQKNLTPGCQIEVSLHGDVIVCVDGKIESPDVPHIEAPALETPITPDEFTPIIESEIIHSPETEAEHHYPQAGEQSLNVNDKDKTARTRKKSSHIAQKIIAYTLMTFFFAGAGFLLFSLFGAAFFILPLLCGAFSK